MGRTDAVRARGLSILALVAACSLLCALIAPVAADMLSPYIVPSRGESIIVLSTRSTSFAGTSNALTLTPAQLADPQGGVAIITFSYPYALFISRVVEVAVLGDPTLEAFALRYSNGSIELAHRTAELAFEYTSEWLQGPYAGMANGDSHLCFLRESGLVECRAAAAPVAGFDVGSGVLMNHRSGVSFTQITAANCFTCGLRANDSKVECYGDVILSAPAVRMTLSSSLLQYSVIAAEYAGAWCGLTLDAAGRDLYCWSFSSPTEVLSLPAPTAPLFWRALFFSNEQAHGCALRSDGRFACGWTDSNIAYPAPADQAVAVSDLTSWRMHLSGAVTSTGNVLDYYEFWSTEYPSDFAFSPLRFIGIDGARGNDTLCNSANTLSITELRALIPCATLAGALTQLTRRNTWIQLLPGTHYGGDAAIGFVDVTLSSQPPSCLTQTEIAAVANGSWAQRMAEAAALNSVALLNCTGFVNCVSSSFERLSLQGLSFTGASEHAIVHNFVLPDITDFAEPELTILNCSFSQIGGMLRKSSGRALIRSCSMSDSTQTENVRALVDLEEVILSLENSTFERHTFLDSLDTDPRLRTCVSVHATRGQSVSVTGCRFTDAHVRTPAAFETTLSVLGGVAIQVNASSVTLSIVDCEFTRLSTQASHVYGGAVGVFSVSPSTPTTNSVSVTLRGCVFDHCSTTELSRGGGGGIAVSEHDPKQTTALGLGASVVIESCQFVDNSVGDDGAAILIGSVSALTITDVVLTRCNSRKGGIWIGQSEARALLFPQSVFALTRITAVGCSAQQGGVLALFFLATPVQLASSNFTDSYAGKWGGAIYMESGQSVQLQDVHILRASSAHSGGAMYISTIQRVTFSDCSFIGATSLRAGGAMFVQYSKLDMVRLTFADCGLFEASSPIEGATSRNGGALYLLGGTMKLIGATFTRCAALPTTMSLATCADSWDPTSGICSEGQGGSISVELSQVEIREVVVTDGRACSGGFLSLNGDDDEVHLWDVYSTNTEAWSGGVYAFRAAKNVLITYNRFTNSVARSNGGAITFAGTLQADLFEAQVTNVSCTPLLVGDTCDGGAFWATSQRYFNFMPSLCTFVDVTAAGAGAIFYTHLQSVTPAALWITLPLNEVDLDYIGNVFSNVVHQPPFAQYGPHQASSAVALTSSISEITIYPGQLLDALLPILVITVRDAYGQAMTMNRNLVVRLRSIPADSSAQAAERAARVAFAGTTLQSVQAASGAANFSTGDLHISAPPGQYVLSFSLVSLPVLTISVALTVIDSCPAGLYYSLSTHSCTACSSDILVYTALTNTCERCEAGMQRTTPLPGATGGPLNDGVFCEVCPLGSVSTSGSRCAPCPPNTYQPTPFAACVQCSEIAGLACAGDGLAQVQSDFFALSVGSGSNQQIQTFQCPAGFCSPARVQTSSVVNSGASSAVNAYDQCAFPRLASPTNLLCGECVEGYRPWGNKCAQCDSVDGGLLFLLIVVSWLLLGWLIRSSLGPPSAGHAVVVLYFVQTAMLELGSLNNLLAWLNVVLLSPNSVGRCVAPLTPYQQTQAQILMPLALWIELCIIALIHFAAWRRWGKLSEQEGPVRSDAPLFLRVRGAALMFISLFSVDVYVSATLSLLLFSYTQVAVACVTYLRCVDVGGVEVVFAQPSMRCASSEYTGTAVLVVLAGVGYIVCFPLFIAVFLRRRAAELQKAHAWLGAQEQLAKAVPASDEADDGAGASRPLDRQPTFSPAAAVSAADLPTVRFLRRYAPLFAMYSSSAWFWQVIVLARRACFVAVSVALLPTPRRRFVAFALATLCSLLLQLIVDPFRVSIFNRAEVASHSLLIILSITLTSEDPPFSEGVNAFVFLLVVPPLCLYIAWAVLSKVQGARAERRATVARQTTRRLQSNPALALSRSATLAASAEGVSIELAPSPSAQRTTEGSEVSSADEVQL